MQRGIHRNPSVVCRRHNLNRLEIKISIKYWSKTVKLITSILMMEVKGFEFNKTKLRLHITASQVIK